MLDRHLALRILSSFVAILSILTISLAAMQFVRLGPLFLGPWVRLSDASCLAALIPFLSLGVPSSLAIACALVASSMSRRGERQAVAGAGIRVRRLMRVPLALALAGALVTAALSLAAAPRGFALLERSLASLATRAAFGSLPEGRFFDLPGGGILFAGTRSRTDTGLELGDVLVSYEVEDGPGVVISSPLARITHRGAGECTFSFSDAHMVISGGDAGGVSVDAGSVRLPVDLGEIIRSRAGELPTVLAEPTASLASGLHGPAGTYHLHRRIALPVASLAVLLLSCAFFFPSALGRPAAAPAVTVGVLVAFHGLMRLTEEASLQGALLPVLAAWIPAAVLAIAAAVTWILLSRRAGARASS
ncbi:MAG: LptF/LptG family permease [Deltaproteobacteria bacterium]|nr:LptF/LptG family permease [Deltaproteobacteria bacterium]